MSTKKIAILSTAVAMTLLFGCESQEEDVDQGRVIINNHSFDNRVNYDVDSTIVVGTDTAGRSKRDFALKLRAEVFPPVHNGTTLRASHVYVDNDYAYVVYNLEGEPYLGGVEIFNIKNIRQPFIESQAIFINTDVSSVYFDRGKIYLAEATGDEGFGSPAVLEEIQVENGRLTTKSRRAELSSYAGTDVSASADQIVATSGSGGGLFILDRNTLEKTGFIELDDARAVTFAGPNSIATFQGTPARLSFFGLDGTLQTKIELQGATIPESKSVLAQKDHTIFVAAGDGGTYSIDVNTGKINFNIPNPNGEGLDPLTSVCNSVAASSDILFMANGEAGLYAAKIHNENTTFTEIGPIRFSGHTSVNHISLKNRTIFLATGTGGLKIVELEQ